MGYRFSTLDTCAATPAAALPQVPDTGWDFEYDSYCGDGNLTCTTDLLGSTGWKVIISDGSYYGFTPGTIVASGSFLSCDLEAPITYSVGGTVSGWAEGLALQLNAGTPVTIAGNGPFTIASGVEEGYAYDVHVSTQPTGHACTVTDGVGVVGVESVTGITVACEVEEGTDTTFELPSGPETAVIVAVCTLFALGWIAGRG